MFDFLRRKKGAKRHLFNDEDRQRALDKRFGKDPVDQLAALTETLSGYENLKNAIVNGHRSERDALKSEILSEIGSSDSGSSDEDAVLLREILTRFTAPAPSVPSEPVVSLTDNQFAAMVGLFPKDAVISKEDIEKFLRDNR